MKKLKKMLYWILGIDCRYDGYGEPERSGSMVGLPI